MIDIFGRKVTEDKRQHKLALKLNFIKDFRTILLDRDNICFYIFKIMSKESIRVMTELGSKFIFTSEVQFKRQEEPNLKQDRQQINKLMEIKLRKDADQEKIEISGNTSPD